MSVATSALAPSEKQIAYANSLYAEYGKLVFASESFTSLSEDDQATLVQIHIDLTIKLTTMNRRQMSEAIDSMKRVVERRRVKFREEQAINTPAPAPVVSLEGMHKLGDRIFKVQVAVHGTGREYAKELTQDIGGDFSFAYAPGMIRSLSLETKMTLEDAKKFGKLYGTCCVCGRTLTDETSIENGIGPICGNRF